MSKDYISSIDAKNHVSEEVTIPVPGLLIKSGKGRNRFLTVAWWNGCQAVSLQALDFIENLVKKQDLKYSNAIKYLNQETRNWN